MPFRHFALILELEVDRRLFPEAISTSLLDESCGGDVEDETLPELVMCEIIRFAVSSFPICGQPWLLTADPLTGVSVVLAKLAWR